MTTSPSSRTSHSLSRRTAAQSARTGIVRQRSESGVSGASTKTASTARETGSATTGRCPSFEADALSDSPSRRKMQLERKINERQEADMKEREREQRKALLKERRLIGQQVVQAKHAANEQHSKAKRGLLDIDKVQVELERLEKWREKENERLNTLMRQLIEEQQKLEEEYATKHDEALEIKSTLAAEQQNLENDLRVKVEETRKAEAESQRVEEALRRLDQNAGIVRKESWQIPSLDDMGATTTCSTNWSRIGLESSSGFDFPESTSSAASYGQNKVGFGSIPGSISSVASSLNNRIGFGSLVLEPHGVAQNEYSHRRPSSSDGTVTLPGHSESTPEAPRQRVVVPGGYTDVQQLSLSAFGTPSVSSTVAPPSPPPRPRSPPGGLVGLNSNVQMARSDSNVSSMTQRLTDQGHPSPMPMNSSPSPTKPLPAAFPIKNAEGTEQRLPQSACRFASPSPVRTAVVSNSQMIPSSAAHVKAASERRPSMSSDNLLIHTPISQRNSSSVRQASPIARRNSSPYGLSNNPHTPPAGYPANRSSTPQVPLSMYNTVAPVLAPSAVPVSASGILNWDV